jgi:chloramphenicol-sensitive protein RarD
MVFTYGRHHQNRNNETMQDSSKGLLAAIAAFALWGLLPLYLKALAPASPFEILCHRIVWSVVATLSLLFIGKRTGKLLPLLRDRKIMLPVLLTAILVSGNWIVFIWAVNNDFIVESSLGYFINPLVNVLLGFIFLQERLRRGQWLAVFFAFSGVCYLTLFYGQFPWIALFLAFSFGFYGLLRKISPLPSLEGLCLETCLLSIPAILFLVYLMTQGQSDFVQQDTTGRLLLIGTGIITSLPLLLFAFAAQRMQLSTLGIVQYLAPTLQLCIGVFVYGEAFPVEKMLGFALVWCGLLIYATEGVLIRLKQKKHVSPLPQ